MRDPAHARATRPADPATARRPTSTPRRTGGTARRSTAATRSSPARLRTGEDGKLRIDDGRPAAGRPRGRSSTHADVAGQLVARAGAAAHAVHRCEHNAICDRLRAEYPRWSDEQLFDKARLVNAALMAKIHTVEWTPAILAHPTLQVGDERQLVGPRRRAAAQALRAAQRQRGDQRHPRLADATTTACPYSLTEEFVAVYRMHPLIPDDFDFRSLDDDASLAERTFPRSARARTRASALERARRCRTCSTRSASRIPGAITLHNYPRFLQHFERPDGELDRPRRDRHPARRASAACRATTSSASCST